MDSMLPPLSGVAHATRRARATAGLVAVESKEDHMDLSDGAAPAASSSEPSSSEALAQLCRLNQSALGCLCLRA